MISNSRISRTALAPTALGLTTLCLALSLSLGGCKFTEDIDKLVVADVHPSAVKDGVYEASQDNKIVTATVRVEVKGGKIVAIDLLKHDHGPKHGADALIPKVLAAQSLKVDSVSGATYSSKVLLKAIELALDKGL